jgi:hypothetical protein
LFYREKIVQSLSVQSNQMALATSSTMLLDEQARCFFGLAGAAAWVTEHRRDARAFFDAGEARAAAPLSAPALKLRTLQ